MCMSSLAGPRLRLPGIQIPRRVRRVPERQCAHITQPRFVLQHCACTHVFAQC